MILRHLLRQAQQQLAAAGCDTPRLDAEVLWMHVSDHSRCDLILQADQAVDEAMAARFQQCLAQRCQRQPVAYITGEKEFWSLRFEVNPDVLIPRPETEHMLEWLLQQCPDRQRRWCFADVGTGSGCIAVSMACIYPQAHIVAADISLAALCVARRNAERHGVASRISFICADLLSAVAAVPLFDAILSNPPYVSASAMQAIAAELHYEPVQALTDRGDGLRCMRTLLKQAACRLKADACLCVESGLAGYVPAVPPMHVLRTYNDLAGRFRGVVYQKRL